MSDHVLGEPEMRLEMTGEDGGAFPTLSFAYLSKHFKGIT